MFILQIGGWFIFSCILMSFIEHQVNRRLMHRRNFLAARTASYKRMFEAHALVHHKDYAEILSDAPVAPGEDKEIRLTVRKAPNKAIPYAACIALVSWQGAVVFVAVMTFHHWAWNKLHLEMHKPEQRVLAPGRSISSWRDIIACITDTWTGTSTLCFPWLTMFLELAFEPTKAI
jgi:hypothetical protein